MKDKHCVKTCLGGTRETEEELKDQKDDKHFDSCSIGKRRSAAVSGQVRRLLIFDFGQQPGRAHRWGQLLWTSSWTSMSVSSNQSCSNPRILKVVVGYGGLQEIRFDLRRHRA